MRALNHKERNELFWQFFIVAFVTLAVLIWALEVDFYLPGKISEKDQNDLRDYRSFVRSQNKILTRMNEIDSLINGIEYSSNSPQYVSDASEAITKFKTLVTSDTSQNTLINKMADIFAKYAADKKRLQKIGEDYKTLQADLQKSDKNLQSYKPALETANSIFTNQLQLPPITAK